AASSAEPAPACSHSGSSPSSSRTTLARLSGSAMRSALISRIVILSTSSPTETGTMMVFMRLLLALERPVYRSGMSRPRRRVTQNLRGGHGRCNAASTGLRADCPRLRNDGGDMRQVHGATGISLTTGIALGLVIGAAIGAMDNVALGIGPGIAIGIALSLVGRRNGPDGDSRSGRARDDAKR